MPKLYKPYVLISVLGLIVFLPFLGLTPLFDWDEINFAESAREMLVTGNFRQVTVNYEPFWEKPPFFFWVQALGMKVFGVGEFAARFPNVMVMIITLCVVFNIGRNQHSQRFAWLWVLFYAGSLTPHLYGHSGIIDPLFNLFIFLSVYQLFLSTKSANLKPWILSGLFLGFAVLTKGPVAGLIVGLVWLSLWIRAGYSFWFGFKQFFVWASFLLAIISIWFIPEVLVNGSGFLKSFIAYQIDLFKNPVASHGQPWFYHFIVLAVGCMPAAVFMIPTLVASDKGDDRFLSVMKILFWVVLILFSLVNTKIVHYSSMCFLPLTYMAAKTVTSSNIKRAFVSIGLISSMVIWGLLLFLIPLIGIYNLELIESYGHLIKDQYAISAISVVAGWTWYHFIPSILIIIGLIWIRRGWIFSLHKQILQSLIFLVFSLSLLFNLLTPAIERHTQHAIIDFYESIQDEDCYVDVYGFKSYAHYFYSRVQPPSQTDGLAKLRKEELKKMQVERTIGNIDRPVYLICQERKMKDFEQLPSFKKVKHEGGFVVYLRTP
jgi:4-amino-4-deoxy-L-arabinose transferase-like glycosyltransferase